MYINYTFSKMYNHVCNCSNCLQPMSIQRYAYFNGCSLNDVSTNSQTENTASTN